MPVYEVRRHTGAKRLLFGSGVRSSDRLGGVHGRVLLVCVHGVRALHPEGRGMSCECRRGSTCAQHLEDADLSLEPTYPNLASCEERIRLQRETIAHQQAACATLTTRCKTAEAERDMAVAALHEIAEYASNRQWEIGERLHAIRNVLDRKRSL